MSQSHTIRALWVAKLSHTRWPAETAQHIAIDLVEKVTSLQR